MSNHEKVVIVDDSLTSRRGMKALFGAYDINIVGEAVSVDTLRKLLAGGVDATFFVVDNRIPNRGDGEKAAALIRESIPSAKVLGLSATDDVTYGDFNSRKNLSGEELANIIITA